MRIMEIEAVTNFVGKPVTDQLIHRILFCGDEYVDVDDVKDLLDEQTFRELASEVVTTLCLEEELMFFEHVLLVKAC